MNVFCLGFLTRLSYHFYPIIFFEGSWIELSNITKVRSIHNPYTQDFVVIAVGIRAWAGDYRWTLPLGSRFGSFTADMELRIYREMTLTLTLIATMRSLPRI